MKPSGMRKILSYLGSVLGIIGTLLLLGSLIVWQIGLETLTGFYEGNKPLWGRRWLEGGDLSRG